MSNSRNKSHARSNSREFAVQAIYSWQLSKNNILDIGNYFFESYCDKKKSYDVKYFYELIYGVANNIKELDTLIHVNLICKNVKKISQIEKAILRISLFELIKKNDIPYKVVINEGIELAKSFGNYKSHKFINSILDKIGFKIRPDKK